MVILIVGATGFIGSRLASVLAARGHSVIGAARAAPAAENGRRSFASFLRLDLRETTAPDRWRGLLEGVDAVVNTVGILRETGAQNFQVLHDRAPRALFDACVQYGVPRLIQVSALGADETASSGYHLSKRRADDALKELPLAWTIVQPSLVFGSGGRSAALFEQLATAPVIPLPGRGDQRIQPVHIADVVDGLVAVLEKPAAIRAVVPFVGPQAMTLREFLARLRSQLGLRRAWFLPVPWPLMQLAAAIWRAMPGSLLDSETLQMLMRGNVGDPRPLTRLMGHEPRRVEEFVAQSKGESRAAPLLIWPIALLRVALAAMWLIAGTVSLAPSTHVSSLALMRDVGASGALAYVLLYGAAVVNLFIGVLILFLRRARWLWPAQIALVLCYTLIITAGLPHLWLEPFGPVAKNLPILAALWLMYRVEAR